MQKHKNISFIYFYSYKTYDIISLYLQNEIMNLIKHVLSAVADFFHQPVSMIWKGIN